MSSPLPPIKTSVKLSKPIIKAAEAAGDVRNSKIKLLFNEHIIKAWLRLGFIRLSPVAVVFQALLDEVHALKRTLDVSPVSHYTLYLHHAVYLSFDEAISSKV